MKNSTIKLSMTPRQVRGVTDEMLKGDGADVLLESLGVGITNAAMDALPLTVTAGNVGTPVQMLQTWIPEPIRVVTAPTKADEAFGRDIIGNWHDEEIVYKTIEDIGQAGLYTDSGVVPLSDMQVNFEKRSVVRLEKGAQVMRLEEARTSAMQVNADQEKRTAAARALAIGLNNIAFNGFNDGAKRTYGMLNDPNLPDYITVADGDSGETFWASKTFNEICDDLQTAIAELIKKTRGAFDPGRDSFTLAIPSHLQTYLTTPSTQYGKTVQAWIDDNYPKMRVVTIPQLMDANGGSNVFYMYADAIDGQKVLSQNIQAVLMFVGFEQKAKGRVEDYSAATAGFMLKLPVGVVRYTGI